MAIKIGIVGTGNVARKNYLPFLSRQQDVELTYVSRTRSKADTCAEEFGGTVAPTIDALCEESPDAILVLTRETQRYEVADELIKRRPKRLFFEKPLVARNGQDNVCEDDFVDAKHLLDRSEKAGIETAMVFNYRFFDQTVRAGQIVRDRGYGELIQASLFVNYACWSHCIDLLRVFGGPAQTITALSGTKEFGGAVDVAGSFVLANGATGTIIGSNAPSFDYSLLKIILSFENGVIEFTDLDGPMHTYSNNDRFLESHILVTAEHRWTQYAASFEKATAAYLDSVRKNEAPPVPGLAGVEELQFEAALRRSIAQSRPVDVQTEFKLGV